MLIRINIYKRFASTLSVSFEQQRIFYLCRYQETDKDCFVILLVIIVYLFKIDSTNRNIFDWHVYVR